MLARGVGDAREGGRRCSRGGSVMLARESAMLARGDLQGHRRCHLLETIRGCSVRLVTANNPNYSQIHQLICQEMCFTNTTELSL